MINLETSRINHCLQKKLYTKSIPNLEIHNQKNLIDQKYGETKTWRITKWELRHVSEKSLIGRFEPTYSVGHYFEKFKVFIDDAHRSFDLIWFY